MSDLITWLLFAVLIALYLCDVFYSSPRNRAVNRERIAALEADIEANKRRADALARLTRALLDVGKGDK